MSVLVAASQKVRSLEAQLRMARCERDIEIIRARASGMTERAIASAVGISGPAVHQILARRRLHAVEAAWRELTAHAEDPHLANELARKHLEGALSKLTI